MGSHERIDETIGTLERNIYDDYPDGIGETPGLGTPVEVTLWDAKVKRPEDLRAQATRFGSLRSAIKSKIDRKMAVGLQFSGSRKVRMFVANHPDLIKMTAATAASIAGIAATATAGAIYLHRHKSRK